MALPRRLVLYKQFSIAHHLRIASPDIVAADSYATSLFGLQPADLAYVVAATATELGRSNLQNLKIEQRSLGM